MRIVLSMFVYISDTRFIVDNDFHYQIVESSQYPPLDNAALEAVKQWELEPTLYSGKTVESWLKVPVEFKII